MKSHVESAQKEAEASPITARPPGSSRRKGPPPGLSITAPSAHQFASEPRVIQSAPLNHSFTGLRPSATTHAHPLSRQILDHSHNTPQYTHEQPQRLPPIHDVFNSRADSNLYAPIGPLPSPSFPQRPANNATLPQPGPSQLPSFPPSNGAAAAAPPSRGGEREFQSADEALRSLSGGREPKLVHYGGHQPPTPPSPLPHPETTAYRGDGPAASVGRRRTREEFEEGEDQDDEEDRTSAKYGRAKRRERERRGSADREREGRDQRKKDEFMALCARAWDLLHS